jgi:hypothetical protein
LKKTKNTPFNEYRKEIKPKEKKGEKGERS